MALETLFPAAKPRRLASTRTSDRVSPSSSRRVVLIDDDPVYRMITKALAKQYRIDVDAYESLAEVGFLGCLNCYDAAIVDFDLGSITGLEIAEYFANILRAVPMILVSSLSLEELKIGELPAGVYSYHNKTDGYGVVLQDLIEILSNSSGTQNHGRASNWQ